METSVNESFVNTKPLFVTEKLDPVLTADAAAMIQILSAFQSILQEELISSKKSLLTNDMKRFGSSIHKVMPNFLHLSLHEGYAMAKELNKMTKENRTKAEISTHFLKFNQYCNELMPEVEQYVFKLKSLQL